MGTSHNKVQKKQDTVTNCFFCKKAGHVKNDCPKYAKWRVKKSTLLNFICSKGNFTFVPKHTWWINIVATTHVSVSMQSCLRSRLPTDVERFIYVRNEKIAHVEAVGLFRL